MEFNYWVCKWDCLGEFSSCSFSWQTKAHVDINNSNYLQYLLSLSILKPRTCFAVVKCGTFQRCDLQVHWWNTPLCTSVDKWPTDHTSGLWMVLPQSWPSLAICPGPLPGSAPPRNPGQGEGKSHPANQRLKFFKDVCWSAPLIRPTQFAHFPLSKSPALKCVL